MILCFTPLIPLRDIRTHSPQSAKASDYYNSKWRSFYLGLMDRGSTLLNSTAAQFVIKPTKLLVAKNPVIQLFKSDPFPHNPSAMSTIEIKVG